MNFKQLQALKTSEFYNVNHFFMTLAHADS